MGKSYCYTMTDIRAISMFLLHLYDLYTDVVVIDISFEAKINNCQ